MGILLDKIKLAVSTDVSLHAEISKVAASSLLCGNKNALANSKKSKCYFQNINYLMIRIQTKHWFNLPSQNIHGQLRSGCQWAVHFLESQFDCNWHILLQALHLFSDAQRVFCLSLLTSFHHCLNPLILEQEDTGIHPASTDILEHNVECLHTANC